jgi:hypothetical protein
MSSQPIDIPKRGRGQPRKTKKTRRESLWIKALKQNGYFVKGEIPKTLPKKGTKEYQKVKDTMNKLKKNK